jgi:hypothetical protein
MKIRIFDGIPYPAGVISLSQCACRASLNTLPAINAVYLGQAFAKYRFDNGMKASLRHSNGTDPLNISAGGNAASAQNALVGIPYYRRRGIINCKMDPLPPETDVVYSQLPGKSLQLTISTSHASKAAAVMIGQNQLKICSSGIPDCQGICPNLHTVRNRINTGRLQGSGPLYLYQTHPAGPDFIDSLQIA